MRRPMNAQKTATWANAHGLEKARLDGAAHSFFGAIVESCNLPHSQQLLIICAGR